MRLAEWLYEKLEHMNKKPNQILYNSAVREDLQTLEPAGNTPKRQKEYVIRKLSICIMIVLVGVTVSAALWIKEGTATKIADNQIPRNLYGYGAKSVSLIADNGEKTYEIPLNIEAIHRKNLWQWRNQCYHFLRKKSLVRTKVLMR